MAETTLKIEGMTCGHCAQHVKQALVGVKGVKGAVVDLVKGTAVVEHDGPLDLKAAEKAVAEEGYRVVQG